MYGTQNYPMGITEIRILITSVATLTAILFILLSFIFPSYAVLVLSIEVILLPSIYIVGNLIIESLLEEKYTKIVTNMQSSFDNLDNKYFEERTLNEKLKYKLSLQATNEKKKG
tara:strand:- start:1295 stop:1636 length:342 start_codon:yes stop_codon:yes gene_type:complete